MALEFAFTFAIGCILFGQRWGAESQIMNHDSFCKLSNDNVLFNFSNLVAVCCDQRRDGPCLAAGTDGDARYLWNKHSKMRLYVDMGEPEVGRRYTYHSPCWRALFNLPRITITRYSQDLRLTHGFRWIVEALQDEVCRRRHLAIPFNCA
jgi:hypothetical protein